MELPSREAVDNKKVNRCAQCNAVLNQRRKRKFCNRVCEGKYGRKRRSIDNPHLGEGSVATGTTGAASELRVCVDLLMRGFEVFRAVSPSCSCDLIAQRNGRQFRIEVRTANLYTKLNGAQSIYFPSVDREKSDIVACALPTSIIYQPDSFLLDKRSEPR